MDKEPCKILVAQLVYIGKRCIPPTPLFELQAERTKTARPSCQQQVMTITQSHERPPQRLGLK